MDDDQLTPVPDIISFDSLSNETFTEHVQKEQEEITNVLALD